MTTPDTVSMQHTVSSGLAIGPRSFYSKNSRNKRKPLRFDDLYLTILKHIFLSGVLNVIIPLDNTANNVITH